MATDIDTDDDTIAAFDQELAGDCLEGHWRLGALAAEPAPAGPPHLWKWDMIYAHLMRAGEVHGMEGGASRRTLRLCGPGLAVKATTPTLQASIQLVKPGEIAEAHRHSMAALRFVLQGTGGFTTVDGEKFIMEPHDLILTPNWCWHDHGNDTGEPMVWIDGLDFPFVKSINGCFFQPHNTLQQDVTRKDGYHARLAGAMRPRNVSQPAGGLPYVYKGREAFEALEALGEGEHDPHDGITLEYVNPLTGGPTFPTLACRLHLLQAGEHTSRHRHTSNTIYHVIEGAGVTEVDGERLSWAPGDCFTIPVWAWHDHRVAKGGRAVMFTMSDDPIYKPFALYRTENAPGNGE